MFYVSGRVQGVSYRAFARKHALELGLTGYAKNLEDGRVEVLACGEAEAIEELLGHLRQGPPWSEVRHVNEGAAAATSVSGFLIL
jgi:acylphosphatase